MKLLDFGIARLLAVDGHAEDAAATADLRLMTAEYASCSGRSSTAGRILADRGAHAEAAEALSASQAIRRERLGDAHPTVVRTRKFLEAVPRGQLAR